MEKIDKSKKEAICYLKSLIYDLDEKLVDILRVRQVFFEKYMQLNLVNGTDHAYLDLCTLINEMVVSFIAPAYHFNSYIEHLILDLEWDDKKYDMDESKRDSNILRRVKYQADAQSLLLSLKMALDRLVAVFTYYFQGISIHTTFGRYKDSGKPKGFIAKVHELKDTDSLMSYIEENYHQWIKTAVSPRDVITHYNDLQVWYHFDSETGFALPTHGSAKLFGKEDSKAAFGFTSLREFTENWYMFFNKVMDDLAKRDLLTDRARI